MKQMTKRERLEATFAGEKVDRVAASFWRHWQIDDQRADTLARATLDFQRRYDWDFIKVTSESDYMIEDWGGETRWTGKNLDGARDWGGQTIGDHGQPVDWGQRVIQEPEDWAKLRILDPRAGKLSLIPNTLELIHKDVKDEIPFIQTIFTPLYQAYLLAGEYRLLTHLRKYPEAVKEGLATITESTVNFIESLYETGVSGIFLALHHASYDLLSEAEYREFGRPADLQCLDAAGEMWFNLLHVCGKDIMFELVSDYPVQAINWHDRETPPTLKEGKTIFPGAVVGGLDHWNTLWTGSPEEVQAETLDAIEQTEGQRLIAGSGCVLPITMSVCNLHAVNEAIRSVGS